MAVLAGYDRHHGTGDRRRGRRDLTKQEVALKTEVRAADLQPTSFRWEVDGAIATVTLDRPERKNPLSFQSYIELRDTFRQLVYATDVKAVVVTGAEGNFCSGGDVHEIIGPLIELQQAGRMDELLAFT